MSYWGQLFFQDAASSTMLHLVGFYEHAMLVLVLVISVVGVSLFSLGLTRFSCQNYLKQDKLEEFWTFTPAILLVILGYPSLQLLYRMEETMPPEFSIKAVGHQWYWSYEYSDLASVILDSYITPTTDLVVGDPRLLDVDHRACLPYHTTARVVVTSMDVIHSFAVPSLGVKVDAIPGRLNQVAVSPTICGVLFGMCSEICGANHAFMPIRLEVVSPSTFQEWVSECVFE